jgi:tetratricopeptide (TPR) repeat protein
MATRAGRHLAAMAACFIVLSGCETSVKLGDLFQSKPETSQGLPPPAEADTTGSVHFPAGDFQPDAVPKGLVGKDPNDDLSLGKKYFRAADFGLAERHFRRAVEHHPRDLESWIGLAASYDRLRRWDLADRAYDQAMKIAGPTPELLNNVGYSLMLRGDYRRARETLLQAQAQDPGNPYVTNNLELLDASFRKGKAIQ